MALPQRFLPNYSYEDYILWEGEWEVIDGIPYAMTPMPAPRHQSIASNLSTELTLALRKNTCKDCKVYQPIDLKINENTIVHPDLLIVCKPITKQYLDFPPELVIEILSPATRQKDLLTKFELYQHFGIEYYLIVDPDSNQITFYQLNAAGGYKEMGTTIPEFQFENGCTVKPDFSQIW